MKTNGPGKYDDVCTQARIAARAVAAIVIIVEGEHGNGFSVNTLEPDLIPVIPAMLRAIAQDISTQNQRSAN